MCKLKKHKNINILNVPWAERFNTKQGVLRRILAARDSCYALPTVSVPSDPRLRVNPPAPGEHHIDTAGP